MIEFDKNDLSRPTEIPTVRKYRIDIYKVMEFDSADKYVKTIEFSSQCALDRYVQVIKDAYNNPPPQSII